MEDIKKNYIYNTIYQVLSLITPLITAPYISRVLGSSGVGIYSYTNSIVTYFTLFAALGTASYGQREIAMHRNDSKASSKYMFHVLMDGVLYLKHMQSSLILQNSRELLQVAQQVRNLFIMD